MKILRPIAIEACVVICASLWGCAESPESPEVLIERGHLMESHGRFDEAIQAYTKASERRPGDATIYYDRGVAYGQISRWKEAIDDYSRAVDRDPAMARAYNNRAAAYAQQHQFEAAVADFTKTISLDSNNALAYRNRGLAFHDLGRLNQAIEDYTVAIRLDPGAFEGHFERGNALLDSGELRKALSDYDRALAINPTRAVAWLNRGEAYRRLGDQGRAQTDFDKARQLDPKALPVEATRIPASPVLAVSNESEAFERDQARRRERAVRVAADYLNSKGFQVEPLHPPSRFELVCKKGGQTMNVKVRAPAAGESSVRFTRDEIDAASRENVSAALVVVEGLSQSKSGEAAYDGGKVVDFAENWKPVREKLVPVVFEYPLHP